MPSISVSNENLTCPDTAAPRLLDPTATSPDWPDWFQEEQQRAWEDFEALPLPTRRDELWRFADPTRFNLDPYLAAGLPLDVEQLIAASRPAHSDAARLVFVNNELVYADLAEIGDGVTVLPLERAAAERERVFRQAFMSEGAPLGSAKLFALHRARLTSGTFVHALSDRVMQRPLEIFYWVQGDHASIFPHTLAVAEPHASLRIVDHYRSADGFSAFSCGANELLAREGSRIAYTAVQDFSHSTLACQMNSAVVGPNAHVLASGAQLGGGMVRQEFFSRLTAPGGRSDMLSVVPADGDRVIDQRTLQDHQAPDTSSDLLYHNALNDHSKTIFSGLIRVEKAASRTDAYQHVKNLLLSDDADSPSLPGLAIENDDVRCSHGATNGPIDESQIFYLRSRGIPRREAMRLLSLGFFDRVLERLDDEALHTFLSRRLADRLG